MLKGIIFWQTTLEASPHAWLGLASSYQLWSPWRHLELPSAWTNFSLFCLKGSLPSLSRSPQLFTQIPCSPLWVSVAFDSCPASLLSWTDPVGSSAQASASSSPQLEHCCLDPHEYLFKGLELGVQHTQIQLLIEWIVALPQQPPPGSIWPVFFWVKFFYFGSEFPTILWDY